MCLSVFKIVKKPLHIPFCSVSSSFRALDPAQQVRLVAPQVRNPTYSIPLLSVANVVDFRTTADCEVLPDPAWNNFVQMMFLLPEIAGLSLR